MRLQETRVSQEGGTGGEGHPAQSAAACRRDWQGGTETADSSNRENRMPQMRKQHRLRLAGANSGCG